MPEINYESDDSKKEKADQEKEKISIDSISSVSDNANLSDNDDEIGRSDAMENKGLVQKEQINQMFEVMSQAS